MLDLILKRRSVRQYLQKEVEEQVLKDILSAGLLAPTGMNKKPCRFYVIKKKGNLGSAFYSKACRSGYVKGGFCSYSSGSG